MVKKEENDISFRVGDNIKVILSDSSSISGKVAREDMMGLTVQDAIDKHIFRFVKWEAVNIIEYFKKTGERQEW